MTAPRRRVLVTGAGGFIGSHLVRDQLARGHEVVATDIDLTRLEGLGPTEDLQAARVDIRSTDELAPLLQGTDTVFHLAAAHLDVLKDDAYFHDVNVRAAADLVRRSGEAGVRRFVHCSTVGVYGPLASLPADEGTPPAPDIAYETTKLEGERAVLAASSVCGPSTVVLRPSWVYGPYCPRTLKLVRTIARRRFFFVGEGSNLRHPIFITDMLEAFELAANCPAPKSAVFIAGGPDTVTVRELVQMIAEELGMDYRPPRLPLWFMHTACLATEKLMAVAGREPPFSRRSLKFFTESSTFDTSRAAHALGFRPRVATREGIRLTIRSFREQGIL
jgi:nucleoside-diphosphate-sugar epimerase